MQNRFKFRIWHEPLKQMHYNDFIITATGYIAKLYQENDYMMKFNQNDLEFGKQCVVMQCTGLRDRHNNLIYEGDIVRFYSLYGHATFEIKWSEEFATFGYEDDETDFSELGRLYDEAAFVEVIGNIYQDKELLQEES